MHFWYWFFHGIVSARAFLAGYEPIGFQSVTISSRIQSCDMIDKPSEIAHSECEDSFIFRLPSLRGLKKIGHNLLHALYALVTPTL